MTIRPIPAEETRPLRQAVLRPHQTLEELASHEPPDAFAVGAFDGERLVGVGLIGPEGEPGTWRVRGMATEPEARGQGSGTAVLGALLDHARKHGAQRVWANVRVRAGTLYERAGFCAISDEYNDPDIGPHLLMSRELGEGR
jgi:GNAT superfamily N-acetyltransferase